MIGKFSNRILKTSNCNNFSTKVPNSKKEVHIFGDFLQTFFKDIVYNLLNGLFELKYNAL